VWTRAEVQAGEHQTVRIAFHTLAHRIQFALEEHPIQNLFKVGSVPKALLKRSSCYLTLTHQKINNSLFGRVHNYPPKSFDANHRTPVAHYFKNGVRELCAISRG
jgi:hypothetical protein